MLCGKIGLWCLLQIRKTVFMVHLESNKHKCVFTKKCRLPYLNHTHTQSFSHSDNLFPWFSYKTHIYRLGHPPILPVPHPAGGNISYSRRHHHQTWSSVDGVRLLTSLQFLRVVHGHIVIQNHQQEERHAQHVGEYGQLYVRHHDAAKHHAFDWLLYSCTMVLPSL